MSEERPPRFACDLCGADYPLGVHPAVAVIMHATYDYCPANKPAKKAKEKR